MDFDPNTDYYKVLGLKQFATKDEVKKKYLELVKMYHPDRNPTADQNKFKSMTAAYTVLSNEKVKAKYDAMKRGSFNTSKGYANQSSQSSNYWSNYANNSQKNNFYGYNRDNFHDARSQYNKQQSYEQHYKESREAYEKWYQHMKNRAQKEQERRQYYEGSSNRYYQDYDAFKREFDKKFGDRESNYKQNFENKEYYQHDFQDPYHRYQSRYGGSPINPDQIRDTFFKIYTRIVLFLICFVLVETAIRRVKYRARAEEFYQYQKGLDGGYIPNTPQRIIVQRNSPHDLGPHTYELMPEGVRRTNSRQNFEPLFVPKN